mmetsp:Transcript_14973/g.62323  ORF Transcript_14973/g.62323 Transcript_14973/m.62323 type:complete len:371 (-) Transcript_14973:351-1463(-)
MNSACGMLSTVEALGIFAGEAAPSTWPPLSASLVSPTTISCTKARRSIRSLLLSTKRPMVVGLYPSKSGQSSSNRCILLASSSGCMVSRLGVDSSSSSSSSRLSSGGVKARCRLSILRGRVCSTLDAMRPGAPRTMRPTSADGSSTFSALSLVASVADLYPSRLGWRTTIVETAAASGRSVSGDGRSAASACALSPSALGERVRRFGARRSTRETISWCSSAGAPGPARSSPFGAVAAASAPSAERSVAGASVSARGLRMATRRASAAASASLPSAPRVSMSTPMAALRRCGRTMSSPGELSASAATSSAPAPRSSIVSRSKVAATVRGLRYSSAGCRTIARSTRTPGTAAASASIFPTSRHGESMSRRG